MTRRKGIQIHEPDREYLSMEPVDRRTLCSEHRSDPEEGMTAQWIEQAQELLPHCQNMPRPEEAYWFVAAVQCLSHARPECIAPENISGEWEEALALWTADRDRLLHSADLHPRVCTEWLVRARACARCIRRSREEDPVLITEAEMLLEEGLELCMVLAAVTPRDQGIASAIGKVLEWLRKDGAPLADAARAWRTKLHHVLCDDPSADPLVADILSTMRLPEQEEKP